MTLVTIAIAWAVGIWVVRGAWEVGLFGCNTPSLPAAASLLVVPLAGFLAWTEEAAAAFAGDAAAFPAFGRAALPTPPV